MKKVEMNEDNIAKLAEELIDQMDMDALLDYAMENMYDSLSKCTEKEFKELWNEVFEE